MPGLDPGIHALLCAKTWMAGTMPGHDDVGRTSSATKLLHAQRDEAQLAVAIGDEQQDRLLAVLLQLLDAFLDVGRAGNRLLRHFDDDVAGRQPLLGGIRSAVDARD